MKIKIIGFTSWEKVLASARTTVGKKGLGKSPSSEWKRKMLIAEHSPIRQLLINWKWEDIQYWVSVHLVRHKIGIEHFVTTQRSDRTGIDRNSKIQGSLVDHECVANAQAIINISRRRLCNQAAKETIEAWKGFLKNLKTLEPELYDVCVPECVYRGFCPEFKCCGYINTLDFVKHRISYKGD